MAMQLSAEIAQRLEALARNTGRSVAELTREVLFQRIEAIEDYYLAEARARQNRKTIPLDEGERQLGLGD